MPTFDVVSEVDRQELRNAVDQAHREVTTRFDFKDTNSTIELSDTEIQLHSSTEDRLRALRQELEEKLGSGRCHSRRARGARSRRQRRELPGRRPPSTPASSTPR